MNYELNEDGKENFDAYVCSYLEAAILMRSGVFMPRSGTSHSRSTQKEGGKGGFAGADLD
jgi:hypothetical protein